jgi:hypothetical protein
MNYAVLMGLFAMIYWYIPSFIKAGSGIQKLIGGDAHTDTDTHRQEGDFIGFIYFFKLRKID